MFGAAEDGERSSDQSALKLPELEFGGPISERVQHVLERAIISGDLKPGAKINVGSLTRQLGISAIPVREALRGLEAQGWVFFRPRYGAYVRERSRKEAMDLHATRQILESEITALAATHHSGETLRTLYEMVEKGEVAANEGDSVEFAAVNAAFHKAMASAAGNMVLAELHDQIALRTQFYFVSAVSQRFVESAREHRQIYEAVEAGDHRLAATLAREHVAATRATVESTLSEESGGQ